MRITGTVKLDKKTKNLIKRLRPGDIAIIDHEDLDPVAAEMLVEAKPRAVINVAVSCSGRYPNRGPQIVIDAGIPLIDAPGANLFEKLKDGSSVEIIDKAILESGNEIGQATPVTQELLRERLEAGKDNLGAELEKFARNTLSYVVKEKSLLLDSTSLPDIKTPIRDRHALVVVRGAAYKDDLEIIRSYIREVKPVLIGVDGGADALLDIGLKPDIVVGDMDSLTDRALGCRAEFIVHAYPNGEAPGLDRLNAAGVHAVTCKMPGTSEDLALLLAYEKGADVIVAVGSHSDLVDFLDKGRGGMSSTFLVRLKVGHKLVDAKGVSKLYKAHVGLGYLGLLAFAAMVAVFAVISLSPTIQDQLRQLTEDTQAQLWDLYAKIKLWQLSR